jgi:uncharacterized protein YbaR (Trm112 family)
MTKIKAFDTGVQSQQFNLNKTENTYMSKKLFCPNCGFDIQFKLDKGQSLKNNKDELICANCECLFSVVDLL